MTNYFFAPCTNSFKDVKVWCWLVARAARGELAGEIGQAPCGGPLLGEN